ncbi:MAG: dolichol-phosphate mannosyltransferase, partial [Gemmatimonadota bacterium]|nr:dolichol-phosphate mannosyltransferase [Gemmatimonadota bacterium]
AGLLRDDTPDTGCGLKVFRRDVFLALPYFDHMHRFLPALVLRHGGRVKSVPVRHRPRERGRSHYGVHNRLWVGLVDLAGVIWLRRRTRLTEALEVTNPPQEEATE